LTRCTFDEHFPRRTRTDPSEIRRKRALCYGQLDRGTGILNNALYRGVIEWNRCAYTKNPKTGKQSPVPILPHEFLFSKREIDNRPRDVGFSRSRRGARTEPAT
jgi:hypothetical protein